MSENIEKLLHTAGLYEEIDLHDDDYTSLEEIIEGKYKTDFYCLDCGTNRVFLSMQNAVRFVQKHLVIGIPVREPEASENETIFIDADKSLERLSRRKTQTYIERLENILVLNFLCSMDEKHTITFVVKIEQGKVMKIGQFPSHASLEEHDYKKFRRELGVYYSELRKAVGLHSHGIGIGSMVYLRRVIEFLVEELHQEVKSESSWDENLYTTSHFDEKIKILENHLPKFLVDNRTYIYSIVSKGIHELDEKECIELFPLLYQSIQIILLKRMAEKEQRQHEKEIASLLGKEYAKLSS